VTTILGTSFRANEHTESGETEGYRWLSPCVSLWSRPFDQQKDIKLTDIQQAMQKVGFRPTKKSKASLLKQLLDGVITPITKPRKTRVIQVQRTGSHYLARFAGQADATFGETREEAEQKLLSGRLPRGKPKKD
jgi:hypothetical protein